MENFDRVHRIDGNGEVQIVVRGLAVVDAESIQQHQRLFKRAAAHHHIRLSAAGTALFKKNRRVLAQQVLRRLQRKNVCSHGQHQH